VFTGELAGNGRNIYAMINLDAGSEDSNPENNILQIRMPAAPVSQFPAFTSVRKLATGALRVTTTGNSDAPYAIQASTNLVNWITLTNWTFINPSSIIMNNETRSYPQRYYRMIAK
jgi:hypothetical protein